MRIVSGFPENWLKGYGWRSTPRRALENRLRVIERIGAGLINAPPGEGSVGVEYRDDD